MGGKGKKPTKKFSTHIVKIQPHMFQGHVHALGTVLAIIDGGPGSHSSGLNGAC